MEVETQRSFLKKKGICFDLACWPHLSHVCLLSIDAGVEQLIEANLLEALEPWQIIHSQDNSP